MAGKQWSGNNWTGGHWDGNNWLGPNAGGPSPTFVDMAAVLTASGAVALAAPKVDIRLGAVVTGVGSVAAQARSTGRLGAVVTGVGAIARAEISTGQVVEQPDFVKPNRGGFRRVRREELQTDTAKMLAMLAMLAIPMVEAIEEEEWTR